MPLVKFRAAGGGEVAVRSEDIFVAAPDVQTPANDTELWWDGPREVLTSEDLDAVHQKLGAAFVVLPAASLTFQRYVVNRDLVSAVIPHPQHANVCFVQGKVRRVAVRGTLDEVLALLAVA